MSKNPFTEEIVIEFEEYFDTRGKECPNCHSYDTKEYHSMTTVSKERGLSYRIFRICIDCHKPYQLIVRSNLWNK